MLKFLLLSLIYYSCIIQYLDSMQNIPLWKRIGIEKPKRALDGKACKKTFNKSMCQSYLTKPPSILNSESKQTDQDAVAKFVKSSQINRKNYQKRVYSRDPTPEKQESVAITQKFHPTQIVVPSEFDACQVQSRPPILCSQNYQRFHQKRREQKKYDDLENPNCRSNKQKVFEDIKMLGSSKQVVLQKA